MKTQYLPLMQAADQLIIDATARSRVLALAIASAVSMTSPLPTSAVESPAEFYVGSVIQRVRSVLSEFNESVVFDLQYAVEQARVFWMIRYGAAHPAPVARLDDCCSLFEMQSGVPGCVSEDLHAFANAHKLTIARLIPTVLAILQAPTQA